MEIRKAAPVTIAIITAASGVTCTTIAHYTEAWVVAYIVACGFAWMAGFVIILSGD